MTKIKITKWKKNNKKIDKMKILISNVNKKR